MQRLCTWHALHFEKCFPFADQTQCKVRKWSEVAARAYRTFLRNNGTDAPVEHFTQQVDDFHTDSTQTERQHIGAQHHHRADFSLR